MRSDEGDCREECLVLLSGWIYLLLMAHDFDPMVHTYGCHILSFNDKIDSLTLISLKLKWIQLISRVMYDGDSRILGIRTPLMKQ